jgi:hypothetical protein
MLVPGFFSHLEIDWELPAYAHFLERLGSFARLITFDKRGTGLSDRDVGLPGSGLDFGDRGEHELKGIEGLRRVYAAV